MSNSVLPLYPGLAFNILKAPNWNTNSQNTVSGRQFTVRRRAYPTWQFRLPYEVLRAQASLLELQTLVGFYNARNGMFDDWLYLDPRENALSAQVIGVGDGTTAAFEIAKNWGSFIEPVGAVNPGTLVVKVAGTPTAAYTLDALQRVITLTTPPTAGQQVTVDGTFYYRCRFTSDRLDMQEFMVNKWSLDLEFASYRV